MVSIKWAEVRRRVIIAAIKNNPDAIASGIRGWLTKRLSPYTVQHLVYAIDHNYDLIPNMPVTEKNFITGMVNDPAIRDSLRVYQNRITVDLVLKWWGGYADEKGDWVKGDRIDLASTIINYNYPKGINWLEEQLTKIKAQLLELPPA